MPALFMGQAFGSVAGCVSLHTRPQTYFITLVTLSFPLLTGQVEALWRIAVGPRHVVAYVPVFRASRCVLRYASLRAASAIRTEWTGEI